MASILKVITDLQCQLYCDCELIGDVYPDVMFKMPLRKGAYIFEFKVEDISLYSTQYDMPSNDEEGILKVGLADIFHKKSNEIKSRNIESLQVSWFYTGNNWRIISANDEIINKKAEATFIDLPNNYNLLPFDPHKSDNIDQCGYIPFNLCGTLDLSKNCITGGRWGCINKIGEVVIQPIYGRKVFFENNLVTQVYESSNIILKPINRFGEQAFSDDYEKVYPINEKAGLYQVTIEDKKGIINKDGLLITPLIYSSFIYSSENKFWARELSSGLWGLIDSNMSVIQPFVYKEVVKANGGFYVKMDNVWGVILNDGSIKISTKYEVVSDYYLQTYDSLQPDAEYPDFIYNYYSIVKVNGKYGIVNTNFEKSRINTRSIDFKEIVPCKYDFIYSLYGVQYQDDVLKGMTQPRLGSSDGIFRIDECIFVLNDNSHLKCYRYDADGNIVDSFDCCEFNEVYKVESGKYYLRNNNLFYAKIPYDNIAIIDFYRGSWDYQPIFADDAEFGEHPIGWEKELFRTVYVAVQEGGIWYIVEKNAPSEILFKYKCDSIVEFGIDIEDNYFAIVEIGKYKKLIITDSNGEIEYESDNFNNIYSSYKLLAESDNPDVKYNNECYLNGVSNDYFIIQLESGKWMVLVYRYKDYNKSAEYDSIKFIDENRVEIHRYENGQKLYNGIYIERWEDMNPVFQQWSNTPLVIQYNKE